MKSWLRQAMLFSVILSFASCEYLYEKNVRVDIVNNKFQEALETAAKSDFPNKLTLEVLEAEINYWLTEKQPDKALKALMELIKLPARKLHDSKQHWEFCSSDKDYYDLCEFVLNTSIYSNCISITQAYCLQGNYEQSKKNTFKFPLQIITDVEIKSIHGEKAYNVYKKQLKDNQEIEPFVEDEHDYEIFTYQYPQKDALKIIEKSMKKENDLMN